MWRVCKTDWRTGWVRIIFAEGPRVVINALTFISITHTDAIIRNGPDALGFFAKLGANIEALYDENKYQVMILGTMAFTSLVWIIAVIRLLLSALIYLCYLFHSIKGGQFSRQPGGAPPSTSLAVAAYGSAGGAPFCQATVGIVGWRTRMPGPTAFSLRRALSCFFLTISPMRSSMRSSGTPSWSCIRATV